MGDLALDTALDGGDGRFTRTLSDDWNIWGPNGGYIAAVAMRAVGAHTAMHRPASLAGHFLGIANYDDPVELETTTLRASKRAESVRVSMRQNDQPIFDGIAWVIGDVGGLTHDATSPPEVPRPEDLKTIEELLAEETEEVPPPPFKFWSNFDVRPIRWLRREEWETRPPGDPVFQEWLKFVPTSTFDDLFIDAARHLIMLDVCMWPSATGAYAREDLTHIAPSLDLFASFHRMDPASEWLLVDGFSPKARDGLVGGHARVWSETGELLASGGQQMLCRPAPQMP